MVNGIIVAEIQRTWLLKGNVEETEAATKFVNSFCVYSNNIYLTISCTVCFFDVRITHIALNYSHKASISC